MYYRIVGLISFVAGITLWVCRSNEFLFVNGWIIIACLLPGVFFMLIDKWARSVAEKVDLEMAKKLGEMQKRITELESS
jgi:hypothetical protein